MNTRFSCPCTFDGESSFVPRWRPPFVSALSPEDRCHLNGMAVVGAEVKYVTCLGATDTAGGWRANKRDGGLLLEVASGETLVRGLSMPHSPRVYAGKMWLLESGCGTISMADLQSGKTEVLTKLPGFTRGIAPPMILKSGMPNSAMPDPMFPLTMALLLSPMSSRRPRCRIRRCRSLSRR